MTAQEIINLALSNTHTKSGQVGSSVLLTLFNEARKKVGNKIISEVDENFFFEIWKRDAVADQENGEYLYPEADNDSAGMLKLLTLGIKGYSTDTYYTPSTEVDIKTLPKDWAYYLANQSKNNPIHFIADNSIFIAPQFDSDDLPDSPSGNAQIKLSGIAKLIDLTAEAEDSAILIPDDFHGLIALGMEEGIFKARSKKSEAISSANEFEIELSKLVDTLTNRDNSAMQAKTPDDTGLQYGE